MSAPFPLGNVVGTIHSPAALTAALKLRPGAVDFLELRVDACADAKECARLERSLPRLRTPLFYATLVFSLSLCLIAPSSRLKL